MTSEAGRPRSRLAVRLLGWAVIVLAPLLVVAVLVDLFPFVVGLAAPVVCGEGTRLLPGRTGDEAWGARCVDAQDRVVHEHPFPEVLGLLYGGALVVVTLGFAVSHRRRASTD